MKKDNKTIHIFQGGAASTLGGSSDQITENGIKIKLEGIIEKWNKEKEKEKQARRKGIADGTKKE